MTATLRAQVRRSTRSRATVFALALLAVSLPIAIRFVTAPPGATIHVRWQPSIDPAARRPLEVRLGLADGRRHDEDTWRYDVRDTSRNSLRAIVLDPAVADTHYIDRATYALDPSAPVAAHGTRFPIAASLLLRVVDLTAVILGALAALLLSGRLAAPMGAWRSLSRGVRRAGEAARRVTSSIGRWLAPWIPELDARALGAFRIALGCGLVWIAWTTEVRAVPLDRQLHYAALDWEFVHRIAASPRTCRVVEAALIVGALLFTAGVRARMAYALFVAAFFLSTLITLESSAAHDLGLPLVTFIGWLTVPWGGGGLTAGFASRRESANRAYGFAIWWPGLTLGAALLAAAYAKLARSGPAWITGGAVKYHFVLDSGNAPVDWGLWVASHNSAAVALALGAIVVEAAFILNIFARGPRARLAAGAVGGALFAGLYLFQGVYWRAWLVPLLAFLPWTRLNGASQDGSAAPVSSPALRAPQVAAVAVLIGMQLFASAAQIEAEPLLSNFPMYSFTFSSPEHFDQSVRWRLTRLREARADGREVTQTWPYLRDDDRDFVMELAEQRVPEEQRLTEAERLRRTSLCNRYRQAVGAIPAEITLTLERRGFDWDAGRFSDYRPVATFPVRLAALCQHFVTVRREP